MSGALRIEDEAAEPCQDCLGRDLLDEDRARVRERTAGTFRQFLSAHRRVLLAGVAILVGLVFVLLVLPQIAGFGTTLDRLRHGDKVWLALGVVLEALSIGGYIALFRTVFSCHGVRIDWSASYRITMAGVVATKLLGAAGAGGLALTAWALRASGLQARTIARRMAGFEIVLYAIYMATLVVGGVGLATGVLPGNGPFAMTVLPAAFGALVMALALTFLLVPVDLGRRAERLADSSRRRRVLSRLAAVPRTIRDGMVMAVWLVRNPSLGLLGAVGYWAFDIATLWTCFEAFGASPSVPVVVMGYFVGTLANTIPLPGGVGGVEGGMIGAFLAFGVNGSLAVVAVLAYRALSFWLPMLPGAVAYFQLRRTVAGWRESPALA